MTAFVTGTGAGCALVLCDAGLAGAEWTGLPPGTVAPAGAPRTPNPHRKAPQMDAIANAIEIFMFPPRFGADQLCLLDRDDLILHRHNHCAVACCNWAATRKVKRRVHLQAGGNPARSLAPEECHLICGL